MQLPWIDEAKKWIGIKEMNNNPKVLNFATIVGGDVAQDYNDTSIPWCGLFIAFCMAQIGVVPVETPLWARNWAKFGTHLDVPAYGCIIVFARGNAGHVGFYMGENSDYYFVLGGNQSDSVCLTQVAKNRAIAYRWPSEMEKFLNKGRVQVAALKNVTISSKEV